MNEERIINEGPVALPEGVNRDEIIELLEAETHQEALERAIKELNPNQLAALLFTDEGDPVLGRRFSLFDLMLPKYKGEVEDEDKENYKKCLQLLLRYAKNVELPLPRTEENALPNENIELSTELHKRYSGKKRVTMIDRILADTYYRIKEYYHPPLAFIATAGNMQEDLSTIIEEIGIENVPFNLATSQSYWHGGSIIRLLGWVTIPKDPDSDAKKRASKRPMEIASRKKDLSQFEFYLKEYLKMKHNRLENKSLEEEVFGYDFGNGSYLRFVKEFKKFPGVLDRAIKKAKEELGEDLNQNRLNQVAKAFEDELIPKLSKEQDQLFSVGPFLLFLMLTASIVFAPIAVPIWIGMWVNRPIKRYDLSPKDKTAYEAREKLGEFEEITIEEESHAKVADALAKSPVKERKGEVRLRKVTMPYDEANEKDGHTGRKHKDKTAVYYTSYNGQGRRFFSHLREARREYNASQRAQKL